MIRSTISLLTLLLLTAASGPAAAELIEVDAPGLVAHLYRPAGAGPHPAVVLVGGSNGGIDWQDGRAELLARHGFVALALAYFGMEALPSTLERIPLEYFDHALTYLRLQPFVDRRRIGIAGVSKGGELALLIASRRPEIRAVAAFVPSGIVFQSIAPNFPLTSSWSAGGKEVPFVPYGTPAAPGPIAEFYRAGLAQSSAETLEAATIPVERINGPLLLLSGKADNLWPSTELSERIVARLRAKGFTHPYEHVAYPDAGHSIAMIRNDGSTRLGGTEEGNRHAQTDAQRRLLEFFAAALGKPAGAR